MERFHPEESHWTEPGFGQETSLQALLEIWHRTRTPETRNPETYTPETHNPESHTPETHTPETWEQTPPETWDRARQESQAQELLQERVRRTHRETQAHPSSANRFPQVNSLLDKSDKTPFGLMLLEQPILQTTSGL